MNNFLVLVPGVAVLMVHLDPWHGFCHSWNLKIWIPIEKLAYEHVSYAYLKKWTTPCPSPWGCHSHGSPGPSTWPLSHLKPQNSDSHWKIGIKTCIICIFEKNVLFPVLIPRVAVLFVSLDPRYCLRHTCNPEIRIPIEKLAYEHVSHAYLKKMN